MHKIKKPTIKDVALMANVSIGTVDRVLHNRGRVSKDTEQKVVKILKKLNYEPNIIARSLVMYRNYNIALLVPNHQEDEYWQRAVEGLEGIIKKSEQIGLMIQPYYYSTESGQSFEQCGLEILQNKPDGVIMAPIFLREGLTLYKKLCVQSIPVIMFDTTLPGVEPLSIVGIDSYQSGRVAAELMSLTVHRKGKFAILHFVQELVNAPQMGERERGFISFLEEEGLGREYIVKVLSNKQKYYKKELKDLLENEDISCIFVSTSKAHRVGAFLQENNVRGMTLIGYDLTSKNIRLLNSGFISFLINENPGRQVEQSITKFTNYLIYKEYVDSTKLFPIEIITRTNLETYERKSSQIDEFVMAT
jgi:LacI family transcriptional regulator